MENTIIKIGYILLITSSLTIIWGLILANSGTETQPVMTTPHDDIQALSTPKPTATCLTVAIPCN